MPKVLALLVATLATCLALEEWELLWQKANPKGFAAVHGSVPTNAVAPTRPTYDPVIAFNCSVAPDTVDDYAKQHVSSRLKVEGRDKGGVLAKLRGHRTNAIETGTQYGHTLAAIVATNAFEHIHSVEFADANYEVDVARFKNTPQVKLWHGDSGKLIAEMLAESARTPQGARGAVIWLDAHYTNPAGSPGVTASEQVPLTRELKAILADRYAAQHVVVMDDLRLWKRTNPSYPTPSKLFSYVCSQAPSAVWHMQNDHLRFKIHTKAQ